MKLSTAALAAAACLAVVGGGLSLLTLLPVLGLVWGAMDWAWVIGLPLAWWLTRGTAPKPDPKHRRSWPLHLHEQCERARKEAGL